MPVTSHYTTETIRRGLLALAKHGGNAQQAHKELKAQNTDPCPTARTLINWKTVNHPDLYRELHSTHAREIEAALVSEFREVAISAAHASLEAVNVARTQLANGDIKDASGAARNLGTTAAIAMDKLYLATDRPTEARQDRDATQILNALANRLGLTTNQPAAIDSTATEEDEGPLLPVAAA